MPVRFLGPPHVASRTIECRPRARKLAEGACAACVHALLMSSVGYAADDYVQFLKMITPGNMHDNIKQLQRCTRPAQHPTTAASVYLLCC